MKAISLHQPWASLLVTHQPVDIRQIDPVVYPYTPLAGSMVKRFETRSWPFPPALIGQPIAFASTHGRVLHAGGADPAIYGAEREYSNGDQRCWQAPDPSIVNGPMPVMLPLGAIVGSGRIIADYPIIGPRTVTPAPDTISRNGERLVLWPGEEGGVDISDQIPYGDFTPGRYAWLIADAASTNERCPWCWGVDDHRDEPGVVWVCRVCKNAGRCDPIPARGHQRIWNWEAS